MSDPTAGVRYVFDTDHATFLFAGRGVDHDRLTARLAAAGPGAVAYPLPVVQEQFAGVLAALNRGRKGKLAADYARLLKLLAFYRRPDVTVLPFGPAEAATFEDLAIATPKSVGRMDVRVAAVAATAGLTVLTRNAKDFGRIPGVRLKDWTAA